VAAGALALALLLAGAAIYTFRTPYGTIEIETDDPDVAVTVLDRGKKITVLDGKTARRVEIIPGEYDLALVDNGKRLELSTNRVNITRRGKVIVTVRQVPLARATKEEKPKQPGEVEAKPPGKERPVVWPAELAEVMKGRPDVTDDFKDAKSSTYDPTYGRGKRVLTSQFGLRCEYAGGALHVLYDRKDVGDRHTIFTHNEGPAREYLCVAQARLPADSLASWGFEVTAPAGTRSRSASGTAGTWRSASARAPPGTRLARMTGEWPTPPSTSGRGLTSLPCWSRARNCASTPTDSRCCRRWICPRAMRRPRWHSSATTRGRGRTASPSSA
jgi:hypothetical protein